MQQQQTEHKSAIFFERKIIEKEPNNEFLCVPARGEDDLDFPTLGNMTKTSCSKKKKEKEDGISKNPTHKALNTIKEW